MPSNEVGVASSVVFVGYKLVSYSGSESFCMQSQCVCELSKRGLESLPEPIDVFIFVYIHIFSEDSWSTISPKIIF